MCELVVFVADKTNDDVYLDCMCYKAGDVVCVQPDGWPWGNLDLTNPNWRIVKFPGIDVSEYSQFTQEQMPDDPENPPKTLLRRALALDLTAIANDEVTLVAKPPIAGGPSAPSDTDQVPSYPVDDTAPAIDQVHESSLTVDDIPAITIIKPTVNDPAIIGVQKNTDPKVIG